MNKKCIFSDERVLHTAFIDFLWTNEMMSLLPGFGWNDGGCRSLMRALKEWLDSPFLKTYQIVKYENEEHSEHALIRIGEYFIDGDGVSTYDQLYERWLYEEDLPSVIIRPFEPETEPSSIGGEEPYYIDYTEHKKLMNKLEEKFDKRNIIELLLGN